MATATGSRLNPLTIAVLATADDLNGTVDGTQNFDVTGSKGVIIIASDEGTAGTAGVDILEFSRDGGSTWKVATQANFGNRHLGLLTTAGSAVSGAALNAAGTEVNSVFFLPPVYGKCMIRIARGGAGASGTAWVTGAPKVSAVKIG